MKWMKQAERFCSQHRSLVLGVVVIFASACGAASAATSVLTLGNTWSEFDVDLLGTGVQTLSNQSSSGYTSTHTGPVSEGGLQPRVYQEFEGIDVSQVGQKVTASFDVQFHTVPAYGDTQFRFGFGDRTTNQGMMTIMIDTGINDGSSFRMRYDNSITQDASAYEPGNYSGFLSSSGTFANRHGNPLNPNGDGPGGLDNTTTIHTFTTTLERVERNVDISFPADGIPDKVSNGWYATTTWTSDAPGAETLFVDVNNAGFAEFDVDTGLGVYPEDIFNLRGRVNNFDTLGFNLFGLSPWEGGGGGSYTISNLVVTYDDGTLGADFDEDGDVDGNDLSTWQANYGQTGTSKMFGDADGDLDVDGRDFLTWQREFTGDLTPPANISAVPEPSSILLIVVTAVAGLMCRRSKA